MTEEDAINNLMAEVMGEAPAEEAPQEAPPAKEPETKIDVAAIIKQATDQQQKLFDEKLKAMEAKMQPQQEEQIDEEAMQIEQARQKLGMDMEAMAAAKQLAEQNKMRAAFEATEREFKKEFPDVDMKEMGEWAQEVGMIGDLNSGDINRWRVVAGLMKRIAQPKGNPDPITPTATKGTETSVWDKTKKGEDVSMVDLGEAILQKSLPQ
jgi:hypothetical protein